MVEAVPGGVEEVEVVETPTVVVEAVPGGVEEVEMVEAVL